MAKILIIDDEESVRRVMRRILERAGYTAFEASDGHHAIEIFGVLRPDVTITDIIMPGVEGLETILELRRQFGARNIIAISGAGRNSGPDYLAMAKRLGASIILEKPISSGCLIGAVEQLTMT